MRIARPAAACLAATVVAAAEVVVDQGLASASDEGPGTAAAPFRSIGRAVAGLRPGDTVVVRAGTYREAVVVAASGTAEQPITIAAEPGGEVILEGADVVGGFTREPDGRWSRPWPHRFIAWSRTGAHPDDDWHALVGRGEQVMADGYLLHQVLDPALVGRGSFCADTAAGRLWLRPADDVPLDRGLTRIEASLRPVVLAVSGAHVRIRGLHLRHAANQAQQGMATFAGAGAVVEDCIFSGANSVGAHFSAPDIAVRRCTFADNGQLGFRAEGAHRLRLEACCVRGNNRKGFNRVWEAGGNKILMSRGVVVSGCRFEDNRGFGLWFDVGNEDAEVAGCLFARNEDAGLFYEIGYGLHAHDNVMLGNGFHEWYGAWGASGGVTVSSSPGCTIERNLVFGNREGIQFREFRRTTPRIAEPGREVPVWTSDAAIRANLLAANSGAAIHGWFDLTDQRHWPRVQQRPEPDLRRDAPETAPPFGAADPSGQPVGLALEDLRLDIAGNRFAPTPGRPLLEWGVPWRRCAAYATPEEARAALGLAAGELVAGPPFADPLAGDFRLPAGHPVLAAGCYPRGEVPGVRLGALP